jgi:hypothetical protein
MKLRLDQQRCQGKRAGPQGLQTTAECFGCARRVAWNPPGAPYMEPPKETPCPKWISCEQMGS